MRRQSAYLEDELNELGYGIELEQPVARKPVKLPPTASDVTASLVEMGFVDPSELSRQPLDVARDVNVPSILRSMFSGTKYKYGTCKPGQEADCSALTQTFYKKIGVNLPRTAMEQYRAAQPISPGEAKPGDLIFFGKGDRVDHVGVYLGNGVMGHMSSKKGYTEEPFDTPYYRERFKGFGRVAHLAAPAQGETARQTVVQQKKEPAEGKEVVTDYSKIPASRFKRYTGPELSDRAKAEVAYWLKNRDPEWTVNDFVSHIKAAHPGWNINAALKAYYTAPLSLASKFKDIDKSRLAQAMSGSRYSAAARMIPGATAASSIAAAVGAPVPGTEITPELSKDTQKRIGEAYGEAGRTILRSAGAGLATAGALTGAAGAAAAGARAAGGLAARLAAPVVAAYLTEAGLSKASKEMAKWRLDKPLPIKPPEGIPKTIWQAAEAGLMRYLASEAILAGDFETAAKAMRRYRAMPKPEGLARVESVGGPSPFSVEGLKALLGDEGAGATYFLIEQFAQQIPESVRPFAAMLTSAATGTGKIALAYGIPEQIRSSLKADFKLEFLSELENLAGDLSDPENIRRVMSDPETYARARELATRHGVAVAAVDALFTAIGLKLGGPISRAVKASQTSPIRKAVTAGTLGSVGVGVQTLGEGLGEYAGKLAQGKDVRDPEVMRDIMLEALGGGVSAVAETATGAAVAGLSEAKKGVTAALRDTGPIERGTMPDVKTKVEKAGDKYRVWFEDRLAGEYEATSRTEAVAKAKNSSAYRAAFAQKAIQGVKGLEKAEVYEVIPDDRTDRIGSEVGGVSTVRLVLPSDAEVDIKVVSDEAKAAYAQQHLDEAGESLVKAGVVDPETWGMMTDAERVDMASRYTSAFYVKASEERPATIYITSTSDIPSFVHELVHFADDTGLITKEERKTLLEWYLKNNPDANLEDEMARNEAIASIVQRRLAGRQRLTSNIARIVDRVIEFIRVILSPSFRRMVSASASLETGEVLARVPEKPVEKTWLDYEEVREKEREQERAAELQENNIWEMLREEELLAAEARATKGRQIAEQEHMEEAARRRAARLEKERRLIEQKGKKLARELGTERAIPEVARKQAEEPVVVEGGNEQLPGIAEAKEAIRKKLESHRATVASHKASSTKELAKVIRELESQRLNELKDPTKNRDVVNAEYDTRIKAEIARRSGTGELLSQDATRQVIDSVAQVYERTLNQASGPVEDLLDGVPGRLAAEYRKTKQAVDEISAAKGPASKVAKESAKLPTLLHRLRELERQIRYYAATGELMGRGEAKPESKAAPSATSAERAEKTKAKAKPTPPPSARPAAKKEKPSAAQEEAAIEKETSEEPEQKKEEAPEAKVVEEKPAPPKKEKPAARPPEAARESVAAEKAKPEPAKIERPVERVVREIDKYSAISAAVEKLKKDKKLAENLKAKIEKLKESWKETYYYSTPTGFDKAEFENDLAQIGSDLSYQNIGKSDHRNVIMTNFPLTTSIIRKHRLTPLKATDRGFDIIYGTPSDIPLIDHESFNRLLSRHSTSISDLRTLWDRVQDAIRAVNDRKLSSGDPALDKVHYKLKEFGNLLVRASKVTDTSAAVIFNAFKEILDDANPVLEKDRKDDALRDLIQNIDNHLGPELASAIIRATSDNIRSSVAQWWQLDDRFVGMATALKNLIHTAGLGNTWIPGYIAGREAEVGMSAKAAITAPEMAARGEFGIVGSYIVSLSIRDGTYSVVEQILSNGITEFAGYIDAIEEAIGQKLPIDKIAEAVSDAAPIDSSVTSEALSTPVDLGNTQNALDTPDAESPETRFASNLPPSMFRPEPYPVPGLSAVIPFNSVDPVLQGTLGRQIAYGGLGLIPIGDAVYLGRKKNDGGKVLFAAAFGHGYPADYEIPAMDSPEWSAVVKKLSHELKMLTVFFDFPQGMVFSSVDTGKDGSVSVTVRPFDIREAREVFLSLIHSKKLEPGNVVYDVFDPKSKLTPDDIWKKRETHIRQLFGIVNKGEPLAIPDELVGVLFRPRRKGKKGDSINDALFYDGHLEDRKAQMRAFRKDFDAFIKSVRKLDPKTGYPEDPWGHNDKAGVQFGFPILTCSPSQRCFECYAAVSRARPTFTPAQFRNWYWCEKDPEGFGRYLGQKLSEKIASLRRRGEIAAAQGGTKIKLPPADAPFSYSELVAAKIPLGRFLDCGDMYSRNIVKTFNACVESCNLPLQVFSRNRDGLYDLKADSIQWSDEPKEGFVLEPRTGRYYRGTTLLKMASVDTGIYMSRGRDTIIDDQKNGLRTCYMLSDPVDVPIVLDLYLNGGITSVLPTSPKFYSIFTALANDESGTLFKVFMRQHPDGDLAQLNLDWADRVGPGQVHKMMRLLLDCVCPCDTRTRPLHVRCQMCQATGVGCQTGNMTEHANPNAVSQAAMLEIVARMVDRAKAKLSENLRHKKEQFTANDFRVGGLNYQTTTEDAPKLIAILEKLRDEQFEDGVAMQAGSGFHYGYYYEGHLPVTDPARIKALWDKYNIFSVAERNSLPLPESLKILYQPESSFVNAREHGNLAAVERDVVRKHLAEFAAKTKNKFQIDKLPDEVQSTVMFLNKLVKETGAGLPWDTLMKLQDLSNEGRMAYLRKLAERYYNRASEGLRKTLDDLATGKIKSGTKEYDRAIGEVQSYITKTEGGTVRFSSVASKDPIHSTVPWLGDEGNQLIDEKDRAKISQYIGSINWKKTQFDVIAETIANNPEDPDINNVILNMLVKGAEDVAKQRYYKEKTLDEILVGADIIVTGLTDRKIANILRQLERGKPTGHIATPEFNTALRMGMIKLVYDAVIAAQRLAQNPTRELAIEYAKREAAALAAVKLANAKAKEAGQTLRSYSITVRQIPEMIRNSQTVEFIEMLLRRHGWVSPEDIAAILEARESGDFTTVAKIISKYMLRDAGLGDAVASYVYNNVLSGGAVANNLVGNVTSLITRLLFVDFISSLVAVARPKQIDISTGKPVKITQHPLATIPGMLAMKYLFNVPIKIGFDFNKAMRNARSVMLYGVAVDEGMAARYESIYEFPDWNIKTKNGKEVRIIHPFNVFRRVMSATDQFVRTIAVEVELQKRSIAEAIHYCKKNNIKPTWLELVKYSENIRNSFDYRPEIIREAINISDEILYTSKYPTLVAGLMNFMNSSLKFSPLFVDSQRLKPETRYRLNWVLKGWRPFRAVGLFLRVPFNIARFATHYSPIGGLSLLAFGGEMSTREQNDRIAKVIIGTFVISLVVALVKLGLLKLVGRPPEQKGLRDEFYARGYRPYTITIGNRTLPLQTLGPFAPILYALADYINAHDTSKTKYVEGEPKEANPVARAMSGFIKGTAEATFMTSINSVMQALLTQEDYWVDKVMENTANMFVPFSGLLGTIARATDKYQRDVWRGADDTVWTVLYRRIKIKIPGVRQTLPIRYSALGEPSLQLPTGLGAIAPPLGYKVPERSRVSKELERIGYSPGMMVGTLSIALYSEKVGKEKHSRMSREAGEMTMKALDDMMFGDERFSRIYNRLSDEAKRAAVEAAASGVKDVVRNKYEAERFGLRHRTSERIIKKIVSSALRSAAVQDKMTRKLKERGAIPEDFALPR